MSFFNPEFPIKEKPICKHPWEHRIKGKFTSLYKYSHNSVENPLYPLPKPDNVGTKPIKFTVIGNMVTKPFIYCMHLVRGLHKYRKKEFDSPVVRGVTSVEWPKVWNDLKLHFGTEVYCIKSQVAVLVNNKFLGGEEELKALVETKYVYYYPECLDYRKEGIEQFSNYVTSTGRPCVYLHIAINDEPIGTLIFMLYSDLVPVTCQNFMKLCGLKKGGYAGTPVHRIVQDSWIQCGGFGLKNLNPIGCENYIVPHDRRGVLGMANDGRNKDCSTQFFVLLKPALWMKQKYVAFGQLIEGEGTLKKIEAVPTWYESPTSRITIYKAGVFNTKCHWRVINKFATEYIHGHIEDLVQIGKLFYQALLEKVYDAIERLEAEEEVKEEEKVRRPVRRLRHKKPDSEKSIKEKSSRFTTPASSIVNNDFDVDDYSYEFPEEAEPEQRRASVRQFTPEPSTVLEEPYYLPLTDVPYPGEVESAFNLQRLLRGDYCLETDLEMNRQKRLQTSQRKQALILPETLIDALFECVENKDDHDELGYRYDLDSDDEKEINEYVKANIDKTSFAGPTIKKISKLIEKFEIFRNEDQLKKKDVYNDEDLRLLRIAAKGLQTIQRKTVSISTDTAIASHSRIHRRLTGFVRWNDIESMERVRQKFEIERETESISAMSFDTFKRDRPQSFHERATQGGDTRRSVLLRLYEDVSSGDLRPTLKNYGEKEATNDVSNFAFLMPTDRDLLDKEESPTKMHISRRQGNAHLEDSRQLDLHGHRLSRKVSSDYVNTLLHSDENAKSSIRTVEYARHRPSISVNEYKLRNQKYQEEHQAQSKQVLETVHK